VVAAPGGEENSRTAFPFIAPGSEILVPVPGGGFDYASGSSLAAAHVSGIAALLVSSSPGLTGAEVAELLTGSRPDDHQSVNACRALATLLNRSGCRHDAAVTALETNGYTEDEP
jgi:subtilisin family serine protease